MAATKAPKAPATKAPDEDFDPETTKTVDGVDVYEPHTSKTRYKPGDVAYGHKRPCMLADGTYPDDASDDE